MSNIKGEYWHFYLMGRDAKRLPQKPDIDEQVIRERLVANGEPFHDVMRSLCDSAVKLWATERRKRAWIAECESAIASAGGDSEAAHAAFLAGVTDELAHVIEPRGVVALDVVLDGDEEDGDDDDEDDDDDDEDEEDDDDDDDDDEE